MPAAAIFRSMQPQELVRPELLAPGARVALIAPAGPLASGEELDHAIINVNSLGWGARVADHVLGREGYLAGLDSDRLHDLNRALEDPAIDAIWCVRGGYGCMRLLDSVNYDALRRRPRPFIGFSDITALHAAFSVRARVSTIHGPNARAPLSDFSRKSLQRAVVRAADPCGAAPDATVVRGGTASGVLAGGNLALLAALTGTPFAPDLDGSILVLEDVKEPMYRIDRMLRQLQLSGMLHGVRGIVAGTFTERPEDEVEWIGIEGLFRELATTLDVPCITGVPLGHVDDQWTIPLGVWGELCADEKRLSVSAPVAI